MTLYEKAESLGKYARAIKDQAEVIADLQRSGLGPGGDELAEALGSINSALSLLDDAYESLKTLCPEEGI